MLNVREVGLTAQREIRRNLRSTKGIAMFVLFFLGGAVPSVLQVLLIRFATSAGLNNAPDEAKRQLREKVLESTYGSEVIAKYLAECPTVLYFLLQGTLFFLPLLILLVGFDQIAGEIQHRSIRYSAGRGFRASLVTGKAIGVWAVIAVMIFVLHVTVWIVMLAQSDAPAKTILSWGIRVWLFCVAYAGAYAGLTSLVSSLFRTPIVALFVGAGIGFGMLLTKLILGIFPATENLTWAFPSKYEILFVSPDPVRALGGCALLLAWGAACIAGASAVVTRRDI